MKSLTLSLIEENSKMCKDYSITGCLIYNFFFILNFLIFQRKYFDQTAILHQINVFEDMTSVGVCPKNRAETYTASERLNCGTDKYGTNQYMCVPNKEKTSLVEFCYGGVMELQNSGKTPNGENDCLRDMSVILICF